MSKQILRQQFVDLVRITAASAILSGALTFMGTGVAAIAFPKISLYNFFLVWKIGLVLPMFPIAAMLIVAFLKSSDRRGDPQRFSSKQQRQIQISDDPAAILERFQLAPIGRAIVPNQFEYKFLFANPTIEPELPVRIGIERYVTVRGTSIPGGWSVDVVVEPTHWFIIDLDGISRQTIDDVVRRLQIVNGVPANR